MLSVMGLTDEPAHLEGYGPIGAETARGLMGAASGFYRILTDPGSGSCSYGRDRYEVPKKLRRALQVRDGTCRFPGCSRKARFCDIDHTKDWILGGETAERNLACLCKGHHLLKHKTGWHVAQDPDGTGRMTWTSPEGREHTTYPQLQEVGNAVAQTRWLDATPAPF
ncbi:HNH endonuclease signature motif containing protein [Naasia aerilata]|uniref:HNH endonuclease signature motif containing protein n=1 Tax=Naasia aerilata TaxID=1162966 RepID=UPI0025742947|nr:HNH endonuclease signature motif containing protein [Naasia aerilata]